MIRIGLIAVGSLVVVSLNALNAWYQFEEHVLQFFPQGYYVYQIQNSPAEEIISGNYYVKKDTVFCFISIHSEMEKEQLLFYKGVVKNHILYTDYASPLSSLSPLPFFNLKKTFYTDGYIKAEVIHETVFQGQDQPNKYAVVSWTKDKKPIRIAMYENHQKHGVEMYFDTTNYKSQVDTIMYYQRGEGPLWLNNKQLKRLQLNQLSVEAILGH